jgi:hypothetical protein
MKKFLTIHLFILFTLTIQNIQAQTFYTAQRDNTDPVSFNLKNSEGFWHISGPRSYENNNNLSFYWHDGTFKRYLTMLDTGNIGIGTQHPSELLTVNGKILCEEVEVIADVVPDYVFQKYYTGTSSLKEDYIMPTLEEVEAFTKENHHLPEVPSATEIKEEGLQLKEMTTILLQKVEELTLYTIEQEKRIKMLEDKLEKKQ